MKINYQKEGKKIKANINTEDMSAEEMFEQIKQITGKGD